MRAAPLTVLYDEECGFCRYLLAILLRMDRHGRLLPIPIQGFDGQRLLSDLTPRERLATAHVVSATGRVYSGGDIAVPIARELPLGVGAAGVAARLGAPTRWAYGQLAANRTRLGRFVTSGRRERASRVIADHRRRVSRTVGR